MIDLEHAAADLVAAGRAEPDVERVKRRVAKRRRTRRVVGGLAALVLLAGGAAAAASMADEEAARDAVVTGPGPGGGTSAPDEPTDPWAASQPVDLGGLRVLVPADWQVVDAEADPGRSCGGEATVVLGDVTVNVRCSAPTALRIAYLQEPLDGVGEVPQTRNGLEAVRLDGDPEAWAVPELGVRLTFGPGVDPERILGTIQRTPTSTDPDPEPDPEIGMPIPIALPCGTVVTTNRSALVLPEGLDVPLAEGMGGWAPGTDDGRCAVNLTDPSDPGRHVTFADGPLPYGLAEELGGTATREAGVRWGPIEDGYGAEVVADGATFHVLAYGIDEEEAAALLSSLASNLATN